VPRVVSLVPSITETLVALGAPPVGCTRFCEQPGIPTVGGTKNPDIAAVERLLPHVVLVNDEENRREDVEALDRMGIHMVSVSPRTVEDVGDAVLAIAAAAEVDPPDGFDRPSWKGWLEEHRCAPRGVPTFVAVWARPWITMNAQTYGSSLLDLLGVELLYPSASDRYPEVRLDEVREQGPGLVILPTEPYPFKDHHAERVREAFPDATVTVMDGQDLFWWGLRTPHAVRRLTAALAGLA